MDHTGWVNFTQVQKLKKFEAYTGIKISRSTVLSSSLVFPHEFADGPGVGHFQVASCIGFVASQNTSSTDGLSFKLEWPQLSILWPTFFKPSYPTGNTSPKVV